MFKLKTSPSANNAAIIEGDKYRFTILTSRLIRIEYSEAGHFEDRATQTVINRQFDVPVFTVKETSEKIDIRTEHVQIMYTKQYFSKHSLRARYLGRNSAVKAGRASSYWYFGESPRFELKGTAKTLDDVDGECELDSGIMSKGEICVLDDSNSLVIAEDGWVSPRKEKCIDQYLFCYGDADRKYDYKTCLADFYKLTGNTPLIPRYALGNWWSRYYPYSQQEYISLMNRFKAEDIPFSVAVIDMDWHLVDIDPKYGTGWTGYTWNEELFPDRRAMLKNLHNEGYEVTLNLHPQQGVAAHEKQYKKMAEAMGIDPNSEETIEFDITNPEFLKNYFEVLHHPLEDEGVSFWWIDWQQGNTTGIPGLDPLWMLNHYHYLDNRRRGKRSLIFSRYSGPGSHRYPLGFSGDTYMTWKSLAFQPYFTATASNIGYGWWSHDIGGHQGGCRDNELACRWVQLGVFSPINRLHSGCNPFLSKEPWKYDKVAETSMKMFLKLRHELIPYLYSMNYRTYKYGEPLVLPLYYHWSCEEAYENKTEFTFGNQMLVSPIVKQNSREMMMGEAKVYLPEGIWYDFFSNCRYIGGRTLSAYRDIYSMPVFVKAGGIIPMAKLSHVNDIDNPQNMRIKVFAGADNRFVLYEDDGITEKYKEDKFVVTTMELKWIDKPVFILSEPIGDESLIYLNRNFEIEFIGIESNAELLVFEGGISRECETSYHEGVLRVNLHDVKKTVEIRFDRKPELIRNDVVGRTIRILEQAQIETRTKTVILNILKKSNSTTQRLADLGNMDISRDVFRAVSEIITADMYGSR